MEATHSDLSGEQQAELYQQKLAEFRFEAASKQGLTGMLEMNAAQLMDFTSGLGSAIQARLRAGCSDEDFKRLEPKFNQLLKMHRQIDRYCRQSFDREVWAERGEGRPKPR